MDQAEWEESVPVSVQLATGEAKMRHHLPSNTLVTWDRVHLSYPSQSFWMLATLWSGPGISVGLSIVRWVSCRSN